MGAGDPGAVGAAEALTGHRALTRVGPGSAGEPGPLTPIIGEAVEWALANGVGEARLHGMYGSSAFVTETLIPMIPILERLHDDPEAAMIAAVNAVKDKTRSGRSWGRAWGRGTAWAGGRGRGRSS